MTGPTSPLTLGVFDSGFGGLTVLRELLPLVPGAHFFYLGDTARLPYGAKSQATVARYAVEAARFFVDRGAQVLVIACNTATALALDDIRAAVPVPVLGVIEPGARACLAALTTASASSALATDTPVTASANRLPDVLVLATAATVASHAYRDTCAGLGLQATEKACPLLVPLVEEGWIDHPVTRDVLCLYLAEALSPSKTSWRNPAQVHLNRHDLASDGPGAVLLGCTHYPLLAPAITATLRDLGSPALVIDSAAATAQAVLAALLPSQRPDPAPANPLPDATFECFATDSVEKFARLGGLFLGRPIPHVHLLDLGG